MSEQMEFPETFEKFAKEYAFKDDKEVYTNGSDLIPVFRVKQWLEQHNKMTAEEYRQRMIQAFHNADCDELLAVCVLPTEKEFEHLEWLLRSHYKKEPCEDSGEISDGYHTFNQLYHQRAILFATIVNQNKNKAWKSFKHSDGKYCFDSNGEWFIVGVDTPKGSYTYHYSKEYWDMFDCEELECGKEWDGHTEEDVTRLLSLEQELKWIPVAERLPEEYERVIVFDAFGSRYIGEFIDAEESWGGKHFINEHGMHSKSVKAWMPLPEPYKAESEE